jgi:hypothetical protein
LIANAAQEAKHMFDSLIAQFEEQQKKLQQDVMRSALDELRDSARELFSLHPDLKSFAWEQGTYYNDEYYVYHSGIEDDEVWINGHSMRDAEWEHKDLFIYYAHLRKAVSDYLAQLGEDNLKILFGLGKRIIVTRDDVSVEEGFYEAFPEDKPDWY